jgi:hypothetical protein
MFPRWLEVVGQVVADGRAEEESGGGFGGFGSGNFGGGVLVVVGEKLD